MNTVSGTRYRPDPYIDWELQIFPCNRELNRWCSVIVRIKGDDLSSKIKNLEQLKNLAENKRYLKMTADEYALLSREIEEANCNSKKEDVREVWFIYLPEGRIYKDPGKAGDAHPNYCDEDFPFTIFYVSPPIEGISHRKLANIDVSDTTKCSETIGGNSPKVITAVIDDAISFANHRFLVETPGGNRSNDSTSSLATRVSAIWLQDTETRDEDNGVVIGKRLHRKELKKIDAMIQDGDEDFEIYRKMGVIDFSRSEHPSLYFRVGHGTHVMDLACGADPGGGMGKNAGETASLSPAEWPILAVQLPTRVTADTSGQRLTSYVLQALRTIILWADSIEHGVPLVVNFSYGFTAGPKDGSLTLEREIARMVSEREGETAVVLPAGNSYESRTTARFELSGNASGDIGWTIPPDDQTDNFIEIWVDEVTSDKAPLRISLTSPDGKTVTSDGLTLGGVNVLQKNDRAIAAVYHDRPEVDGNKGRHRFFLAVSRTKELEDEDFQSAMSGEWTVKVENCRSGETALWAHVQRDDTPTSFNMRGRQSYFDHHDAYNRNDRTGNYVDLGANCPITHAGTINAIATGDNTVVVGGTICDVVGDIVWPPAEYSSQGMPGLPEKPFASAFSEEGNAAPGILASGTHSGSYVLLSGTSVAAPQVARLLSEMLAEGKTVAEALESIKNGDPKGRVHKLDYPDDRRGYSIVEKPNFRNLPPRRYPST